MKLDDYLANKRSCVENGWIYVKDEKCRYVLGQPGKRNLLVIAANPSTATPERDDRTISRVRALSASAGYGGWVIVNLYPLVETHPDRLPACRNEAIHNNNLKALKKLFKQIDFSAIWACWGNLISRRDYFKENLAEIIDVLPKELNWYYSDALTRAGNPKHPLYQRIDSQFYTFDISDYCGM